VLVSRFRSSQYTAARSHANFGIKGTLEPISKLLAAVDTLYRWNDSAHGRTVGTHSGSFSGGAHCRWSSWTQTNSDAPRAGSSPVDSQQRSAMAHARAKLSELQNGASALSDVVQKRGSASSADGCRQRASRQRRP